MCGVCPRVHPPACCLCTLLASADSHGVDWVSSSSGQIWSMAACYWAVPAVDDPISDHDEVDAVRMSCLLRQRKTPEDFRHVLASLGEAGQYICLEVSCVASHLADSTR